MYPQAPRHSGDNDRTVHHNTDEDLNRTELRSLSDDVAGYRVNELTNERQVEKCYFRVQWVQWVRQQTQAKKLAKRMAGYPACLERRRPCAPEHLVGQPQQVHRARK